MKTRSRLPSLTTRWFASTMQTTMRCVVLAVLVATASAFTAPISARATRGSVSMMASGKSNNTPAKFSPKGPFGGSVTPGSEEGWIGDRSKSTQIGKFERGEDFLFFQGPAPKTAVQEDLPDFFSLDNLAEAKVTLPQIAITGVGFGTAALLAYLLVQGA